MSESGHGEKNSRRAYLVSIASISGIPKCSRVGPGCAKSGLSRCDEVRFTPLSPTPLGANWLQLQFSPEALTMETVLPDQFSQLLGVRPEQAGMANSSPLFSMTCDRVGSFFRSGLAVSVRSMVSIAAAAMRR